MYSGTLKIKSISTVANETKKYIFEVEKLSTLTGEPLLTKDFKFEAGQFLSIQFTDTVARAYSIASHPEEKEIELIVHIIKNGAGSMILDAAVVGDTYEFKGAFGHLKLSDHSAANLVFCATGTGIAPIRSMILEEAKKTNPREMKLFYGGRTRAHLTYLDELETWANNLKIRLGLSREDDFGKLGKYGEHARITKFLEDGDFDEKSEFYICGSGEMVKSVVGILDGKGVGKGRVFVERFN